MGICQWEKNMKNAKASERFVQNLLLVMPDWHSKLVKPFRDTLDNLDEYYLKNTAFIQMLEEKLTQDELERLNDAVEALEEILPKLT